MKDNILMTKKRDTEYSSGLVAMYTGECIKQMREKESEK